jgi:hypothetical protein
MPKDRPLTRSYSKAHGLARRTLSAVSEMSEEGLVDLDVGFHSLTVHNTTYRPFQSRKHRYLQQLPKTSF